jgi:eukaryotic-like serine/threonine-protein kinase
MEQTQGAVPGRPGAEEPFGRCLFVPGQVVGCFEIVGLIASGGMSQVFEARDRLLDRTVALKAAAVESLAGSLLRKEGQALAAIRHPALVNIYGMGLEGDVAYLVMERIRGSSLEAMLFSRKWSGQRCTIDEAVALLTELSAGLVVIHGAGIAHRDVKPANIMLAAGGRIVLVDLGLFLPEFDSQHEPLAGTPEYMAPETIENHVEPGRLHLVDLYALGVVAFEMLAGEVPFNADDVSTILDQQLHAPVPDLLALRPDVPMPIVRLIHDLLAKRPQDRMPSAEAALWQLRAIQRELHAPGRPRSVLIVDDDADAASFLSAIVQRVLAGASVVTAGDALAAITAMRLHPPDLILLDLEMPGMNGMELCMYLGGTRIAGGCPIIAVSGRADSGDVDLLGKLGVRHFVRKGPGLVERLGATIRTLWEPGPRKTTGITGRPL